MSGPVILPRFRGYTVDFRLREFRRVGHDLPYGIEFIPFDSPKGKRLLNAMRKKGGDDHGSA